MQVFTSEPGNFRVQVPPDLQFSETTREVDSAGGLTMTMFTGVGGGNSYYDILFFDYPAEWAADPNASQALLAGARDGWLNEINGTLMEEHAVSLGNHPGMEGIAEAEYNGLPMKIKYRNYLVRNCYYQISVWIPKDGTFTAEMEAFLQSFELLKDT